MSDLVSIFEETARSAGERPALVTANGTISFGTLQAQAEGFAARLDAKGIGKGDRVLVATPVGIDLYVALAAIWRIGAVAVFPEPAMGLKGLLHAIRAARPKGLVAAGPYRFLRCLPQLWGLRYARPLPDDTGPHAKTPLSPEDPALISFTSGSTGAPKAIERSHAFLLAQNDAVLPMLGHDTKARDLVAFPVFALINLAVGRTSVLPDWRQNGQGEVTGAALAAWIAETQSTRLLLPPALCEVLADHGVPESVTHIFTGGGPVFPDVVDALRQGRPELHVTCVYGSTEAEPIAHLDADRITDADRAAMREGQGLLAGHPVSQVRLRLVEDEIQVAGPHVNRGYLDPSRNAENKTVEGDTVWHRTGDAGWVDAQGRLWLLGRLSAVVEHGGRKIFPFSVETAARDWPGVRKAAFCDMPGGLVLALEGDAGHHKVWADKASSIGIDQVAAVAELPLDRRHRSKVDYPALRRILAARGG